MNILVVGGSGYIASHVGCLFGRRGVDVVTLDNLFVDHPDAMTKHVVDKFTLASTATIFGEPKSPPPHKESPLQREFDVGSGELFVKEGR